MQALRAQERGSIRRCLPHGYLREGFMNTYLDKLGQAQREHPSRRSTLALEL
jgi:hypothetical protein